MRSVKDSLLDRLARDNGTAMLSDLHGYISRKKIYETVCEISSEEYPLEEWEGIKLYSEEKTPLQNCPGSPPVSLHSFKTVLTARIQYRGAASFGGTAA